MTLNLAAVSGALPTNFAAQVADAARAGSVVAKLSPSEPMTFGSHNIISLNERPRAQFVGESEAKAASNISLKSAVIEPRKAQVTIRLSDEVKWAGDRAVVDIFDKVRTEAAAALAEALDLGVLYRLNPHSGTVMSSWTKYANATTTRVEQGASTDADAELQSAVRALQAANVPTNGVAMTGGFLARLGDLQNAASGMPRYPEIGFGTNIDAFRGLTAAVSPTVAGKGADGAALGSFASPVQAFVGNFATGIRWGVQV